MIAPSLLYKFENVICRFGRNIDVLFAHDLDDYRIKNAGLKSGAFSDKS